MLEVDLEKAEFRSKYEIFSQSTKSAELLVPPPRVCKLVLDKQPKGSEWLCGAPQGVHGSRLLNLFKEVVTKIRPAIVLLESGKPKLELAIL